MGLSACLGTVSPLEGMGNGGNQSHSSVGSGMLEKGVRKLCLALSLLSQVVITVRSPPQADADTDP